MLSGRFRRSASLAIPYRKSFAAIPAVSLVFLGLRFRAPVRETQIPQTRNYSKITKKDPKWPTPKMTGKNSKITKKCIFEEFLVFFMFFPGNFGGGPFWVLFSKFRVISGPGDLGLSHWRPESQSLGTRIAAFRRHTNCSMKLPSFRHFQDRSQDLCF